MDRTVDDLEEYTCAICQEVYDQPVELDCPGKHTFCASCVEQIRLEDGSSRCCVCRAPFSPNNKKFCSRLEKEMRMTFTCCNGCGQQIKVSQVRQHNSFCAGMEKLTKATLRLHSRQDNGDNPNRQTFSCPFCLAKHLDSRGLLEHCNNLHRGDNTSVVCPICASMPWGNPNQQSSDFIAHLNNRHRFEYDTFVDYEKDDAEMMAEAIQASMSSAPTSRLFRR